MLLKSNLKHLPNITIYTRLCFAILTFKIICRLKLIPKLNTCAQYLYFLNSLELCKFLKYQFTPKIFKIHIGVLKDCVIHLITCPITTIRKLVHTSKPSIPKNKLVTLAIQKLIQLIHKSVLNVLLWFSIINLMLVVLCNPSIPNPGPIGSHSNELNVLYQNVQGLVSLGTLSIPNPSLNITKLTVQSIVMCACVHQHLANWQIAQHLY